MSSAPRAVRVAVDAVADRPERTFSYLLPPEVGPAAPGSLLLVPYGRRLALGYLMTDGDGGTPPSLDGLKPVEAVVSEPMLTPDLLTLAEAIAAYYRAPVGTTIAAMLPPGLESRLERRWQLLDAAGLPAELVALADEEGRVDDGLLLRYVPGRGRAREAELARWRRAGAVAALWSLRPPDVGSRRVRVLRPLAGDRAVPRRAPLQRALLEALGPDERTLPELADALGTPASALLGPARRLVAGGHVALDWREVPRDPLAHRIPDPGVVAHALAGEQRAALRTIERVGPGGELLLEGIAASGKSDVYAAAVGEALARDAGAILLVPETSLVPQLADRMAALLGGPRLAVLHSGLSAGERHDEWWRILRGEARVVIGTRSAVFAPVERLGLVVIDEEHDGGYKSDRTPRYDARWVARERVAATGARLVLGAATPDLVTIARVRGGLSERARLVERRVGRAPEVEVVDMRAELATANRSIFSRPLADALARLPAREQAILLINRRGAATFVMCRDCGEALRCADCDLPFVFHLAGEQLRCHHCGRTARPPERCPRCESARIRYFGAGTQRVEAELRQRFPALRVARLDSDALAARRGFETIYDDFREGRVDVLVGTQLAAKGLDLPNVTLAAVIAADVTLNLPDYRAAERTFQLLAQVAGRAGRGPRPGRVIVQTYAADHYAVRAAAALDVDRFADEELLRRRLLGYPPYSQLARLIVADADRARAQARAGEAAEAVRAPEVEVLGPLPSYVARRAGRHRFQVVVRAPTAEARGAVLERVPPGVAIDVDPESLL